MKIVCTSDLHGHLPEIPECDLLLIGGDLCPLELESGYADASASVAQRSWLARTFRKWLAEAPATSIVGIAGNHDFVAAADRPTMRSLPWTYLEDESVEIDGLKIWGSPWSNFLPGWVFMETDEKLAERWARIPDDTNVLLVHGPAFGLADATLRGEHVGSPSLRRRLAELPDLHLFVCGHIHEAYNGSFACTTENGAVRVVNASHVNFPGYEPVNAPVIVEL